MSQSPIFPGQPGILPGPIGGAFSTPFDLIMPNNILNNITGLFDPSQAYRPGFNIPNSQINNAAAAVQASPITGVPVLKPVTGADLAVNSAVVNNAANRDAAAAVKNNAVGNNNLAAAQKNLANSEKRLADIDASLRGVKDLTPAQQTVLNAARRQVEQAKEVVARFQVPAQSFFGGIGQPGGFFGNSAPLNPASSILPVQNPGSTNLQGAWNQLFGGGSAQALGAGTPAAAGIPSNPLGSMISKGLQVVGNPLGIPKVYLEWKENVDIDDYFAVRKYLTWKSHCNGRHIDDWMKYEEWKPSWNCLRSQVPVEEFEQWKKFATAEEAKTYENWRKWRAVKQHFKSKYEPYRQRHLSKKQKVYKKFVKSADFKEYKKYKKFLDWVKARSLEGKDIYDISAWEDWIPTYIENDAQLHSDYDAWKDLGGSRQDFAHFVEYILFRKVKQAYKDETEASEDSQPCKFYKDRNFLRRHRRYWKAWDNNWDKKEDKYDE